VIRRLFVPIALNQAATLVFGMIGITLVSHVVPERVYGAYGLFLTLTQVALLLTHSPLTNHASRYWQREHLRGDLYARFLLGRVWRQTVPLALLLLAVTVVQALSRREWVWVELWPLLLASNLVMAFCMLATMALNAGERHWAVLTLNATATGARAFLPVGMALLLGPSLSSLSLGFSLQALAVAPIILLLFRSLNLSVSPDRPVEEQWRQELRDFGRPFMIMGVGGWLILNADRWVVAAAFGEQRLGLFNLASNIAATVPGLICAGLLQWVFPRVFRASDRARTEQDWRALAHKCDQVTLLFLGLSVAGLCALHVIGPYLVGWIIGSKYAGSMPLLIPAGMATIAAQTNQFQYLLLQGQHNSSAIVRIMLVLATIRTAGSLVAAAISWPAFLAWMLISTLLVAWLGRTLIQRVALSNVAALKPQPLTDSVRG
jgi:O-antigen/teichoic acid export membrane protein